MVFKLVSLFAILAVAYGLPPQHYQSHHNLENKLTKPIIYKGSEHNKGLAQYDFAYSVHDDHTKDIKNQMESRKGDMVKGHYDMIDSDGFKRIVDYTADDKSGFQALVHREKTDIVVPMQKISAEHQHQYHHTAYAPHSLEHHYMPLPVHGAASHKHAASYSIAKKPVSSFKTEIPVAKHVSPTEYRSKYVTPVAHKIYSSAPHYVTKPVYVAANHHTDTRYVSFRGVNAKYEY